MMQILLSLQLIIASLLSLVTQVSQRQVKDKKFGAVAIIESVSKYTEAPRVLKGINIFKKADGTVFEIETTEEEYRALGKKDAVNPTNPNGTWIGSRLQYVIPLNSWVQEDGEQRQLINIGTEIISVPNGYYPTIGTTLQIPKYATSTP